MIAFSQLTYTGVLLAVFANQICLPIPSVVFLMSAGALAAQGRMCAAIIMALGVLGCVLADGIWFWFGRRRGSQVVRVLCRFTSDPRRSARRSREAFTRYGLPLLFIAKFIPGLDGLTPPLAGAQGASLPRFLAFDAVGSFLWSATYVTAGYIFAKQLDIAIGWAQHFGTVLAIVIGVPLGVYAGARALAVIRMTRRLRLRHISPAMLDRKLKSRKKVAVIDLLNFEQETEGVAGVPGAMRIDPSRLYASSRVSIPPEVDIVLYSSSGGALVSARAGMGLQRIGVENVWVLEGGLKAWRDQGFPVSACLESPDVVAGRLGVKLPKHSLTRLETKVAQA